VFPVPQLPLTKANAPVERFEQHPAVLAHRHVGTRGAKGVLKASGHPPTPPAERLHTVKLR
jgi:hypothetical protein